LIKDVQCLLMEIIGRSFAQAGAVDIPERGLLRTNNVTRLYQAVFFAHIIAKNIGQALKVRQRF
jgi:hypothetical protein